MAEFGDILEYDRIDSYETLPDKTFAGYQGGSKSNPDRARFLFQHYFEPL